MNFTKVSDGLVMQQGDVVHVDQPIILNRIGEYIIEKCLIDDVYFGYLELSVGFQDDVEISGVDEQSIIRVHRIRPIPREQIPADPLPDLNVSQGNPLLDGQMAFHEMFKQFAAIYGLGSEKDMDKKMADHLAKLEKEKAEQADQTVTPESSE